MPRSTLQAGVYQTVDVVQFPQQWGHENILGDRACMGRYMHPPRVVEIIIFA